MMTKKAKTNIAMTGLINALDGLCDSSKEDHVDETVCWALDELSDQANEQLFGPTHKVIEAYKEYKKALLEEIRRAK